MNDETQKTPIVYPSAESLDTADAPGEGNFVFRLYLVPPEKRGDSITFEVVRGEKPQEGQDGRWFEVANYAHYVVGGTVAAWMSSHAEDFRTLADCFKHDRGNDRVSDIEYRLEDDLSYRIAYYEDCDEWLHPESDWQALCAQYGVDIERTDDDAIGVIAVAVIEEAAEAGEFLMGVEDALMERRNEWREDN